MCVTARQAVAFNRDGQVARAEQFLHAALLERLHRHHFRDHAVRHAHLTRVQCQHALRHTRACTSLDWAWSGVLTHLEKFAATRRMRHDDSTTQRADGKRNGKQRQAHLARGRLLPCGCLGDGSVGRLFSRTHNSISTACQPRRLAHPRKSRLASATCVHAALPVTSPAALQPDKVSPPAAGLVWAGMGAASQPSAHAPAIALPAARVAVRPHAIDALRQPLPPLPPLPPRARCLQPIHPPAVPTMTSLVAPRPRLLFLRHFGRGGETLLLLPSTRPTMSWSAVAILLLAILLTAPNAETLDAQQLVLHLATSAPAPARGRPDRALVARCLRVRGGASLLGRTSPSFGLKPGELAQLVSLREALGADLGAAVKSNADFATDDRLVRLLRTNQHDVPRTVKFWEKMRAWRAEMGCDKIRAEVERHFSDQFWDMECLPQRDAMRAHYFFLPMHSVTSSGDLVSVECTGRIPVRKLVKAVSEHDMMRFWCYLMEWNSMKLAQLSRKHGRIVGMIQIKDLGGLSMLEATSTTGEIPLPPLSCC